MQHYVDEKMPAYKIAKNIGCSQYLIYEYLKKYNIPRRSSRESCSTIKIKPGQVYGFLEVVRRNFLEQDKRASTSSFWDVKCLKCGRITCKAGYHFVSGGVKTCGFHRNESVGDLSIIYWKNLKRSAKKRNLIFDLNPEYAWMLFRNQDGQCAISGSKIVLDKKYKSKASLCNQTASLDRIDSSKGYIEGNVQWVHKDVNFLKGKMTELTLIQWCKKIALFNNEFKAL